MSPLGRLLMKEYGWSQTVINALESVALEQNPNRLVVTFRSGRGPAAPLIITFEELQSGAALAKLNMIMGA